VTSPPLRRPAEHVERGLCVFAHPDDVDFGSAGTVATWTAAGTEVTYLIVTDGDAGGFDDTPRHQMGPLRRAEQEAAAKAVGVTGVRFLGRPHGRLEPTLDLRRDISRVIRQVRPQRVLTSSPERMWDRVGHRDDLEDFLTDWMRQTGRRPGLPPGRLGEAFQVVHTA
jgi:LmbE family N-acetylglucosaminyl deacetylase